MIEAVQRTPAATPVHQAGNAIIARRCPGCLRLRLARGAEYLFDSQHPHPEDVRGPWVPD
jgi:hypothetical protein